MTMNYFKHHYET